MSQTSGEKRIHFATAVRKALSQRNETAVDLATALQISPSTMRTWLSRRRFPKDKAEEITRYLGWNLRWSEIEIQFEIGAWAQPLSRPEPVQQNLVDQILEQEREAQRLSDLLSESRPDPLSMIKAMQKGDVYIHITSTVFPQETLPEREDFRNAMAHAIQRGAYILYVFSSDALHNHWLEDYSLRCGTDGSYMQAELEILKNRIVEQLNPLVDTPDKARRMADRHVHLLMADTFPWFSPNVAYSVFGTIRPIGKEPMLRILVNLPCDYGGVLALPRADLYAMRMTMAVFRHSIGRVNAIDFGNISVYAYFLEHPGMMC